MGERMKWRVRRPARDIYMERATLALASGYRAIPSLQQAVRVLRHLSVCAKLFFARFTALCDPGVTIPMPVLTAGQGNRQHHHDDHSPAIIKDETTCKPRVLGGEKAVHGEEGGRSAPPACMTQEARATPSSASSSDSDCSTPPTLTSTGRCCHELSSGLLLLKIHVDFRLPHSR